MGYALAWEAGLVGPTTVLATTVHEIQVVEPDLIPLTDHDVTLDLIVTPEHTIPCEGRRGTPGVHWEELTKEKIASIPLLAALRPSGT